RFVREAEAECYLVEYALAAEDHDPCERAHHHARENGQNDQENEDALPARARVRANPSDWVTEEEADERCLQPEKERVPQDRVIEAVGEELHVIGGGPRGRIGSERERNKHDQRRNEERDEQRRQRQYKARLGSCHRCASATTAGATASPPPLAGEGQEGGTQNEQEVAVTPSPPLPRKRGGGSRPSLPREITSPA